MSNSNEEKALQYDAYIRQYDEKARQVSLIKSKFDLSKEDENNIKNLQVEMAQIQEKAFALGGYNG